MEFIFYLEEKSKNYQTIVEGRRRYLYLAGGLFPPLLLVPWSSKHIFHGLTLDEMQYKC